MGYQALYRKYRPKNLNEVYGQPVAVSILKNAIENKKYGHAYLFTGSRGCGKTSVAKIVSRMINCENVVNGELCEKCNSCLNSNSNNCIDIVEIDAASNNGIDEIRELKSKINLIPSVLKYKIYIIDEVHMLSIGAFNALLKTIEEPPEHVIFILATTELNKVPTTIISRCQTIEFKKINNKDMFTRLREISVKEKIDINDEAINEIINNSDGGLRDAIGMLDMATSYTNDQITENDIYTINGNVSEKEIEYLAELIIKKNLNILVAQINDYFNSGKDLVKILEKIIIYLKNKMIKNNDTNICSMIKKMSNALEKMKNSSLGKIYFELAIFEICNENIENNKISDTNISNNSITVQEENRYKVNSIKNDSQIDESNIKKGLPKNLDIKKLNENIKNTRINNTFVDVNKQALLNIKTIWNKLNDYIFDREYGALVCELLDATPVAASDKYLILTYNYDSFVEKGNLYLAKYEWTLKEKIGVDVKIIFLTNSEWEKTKKTYIENIKNKVKYNYIDEESIKNDDVITASLVKENNSSDILARANELFDMKKIEIKEND